MARSGLPGRFAQPALVACLSLIVACSSSANSNRPATPAGRASATQAAPVTGASPASSTRIATAASTASAPLAASATPGAAAAVAMSFVPPDGSAPWANVADGCHGVKAPAGAPAPKASDTGVSASEIKLGSVFGITGAGAVYQPIIKIIQDCFNAINADGGIYGRKLTLEIADDQYTPANTKPLTQKLVEEDKIFADISSLGTATNAQVFDYLNEQKVPQLFVATGASQWGADPAAHPWTTGFPPDYQTIGKNFARYIQQNLKGKKIGILYQNDDFGKDYVTGLKAVFGDKGTADNPIVDEEKYETTAPDVSGQITSLKNKGAELLYVVATPVPAGNALKAVSDLSWQPAIVLSDTAVDTRLFDLAGGKQNVENVVSAGWYHQPTESNDPGVQAVVAFLKKNDPDLALSNWPIYGYIAAQLYVEAFKRAGVNPTRASLMQAVESFNGFQIAQLLPGVTVSMSKTDHRPIKCIQLSKAHDGAFSFFGDAVCAGS